MRWLQDEKIAALCIGVGCMLTVTGCGSNVTLNTEQNDMVSEYIAGVLLKHSYENQWEYEKLAAAKNRVRARTTIRIIQRPAQILYSRRPSLQPGLLP